MSPINPPVADCNANKFTGTGSGFLSAAPPCAPNFASPFVDSKGVSHTFDIDGLQHNFDFYSWETFVALNWPNGGGTAMEKVRVRAATLSPHGRMSRTSGNCLT